MRPNIRLFLVNYIALKNSVPESYNGDLQAVLPPNTKTTLFC